MDATGGEIFTSTVTGPINQQVEAQWGVMGDGRSYEGQHLIVLRMVETRDFMTADWVHIDYDVLANISSRIMNEVPGVNRVAYDVSSKPPSTIEWQ